MKNVTPGINRIMVRVDEPIQKIGSIYIPTNKQKFRHQGTLVALGEMRGEYKDAELPAIGSNVVWHPNWEKMPGHEVELEGVKHYIIHVEMLLGELIGKDETV